MKEKSVTEPVTKIDLEDEVYSSLTKALAISTLALDENFKNYSDLIRHSCLWVINDYIENAVDVFEKLQCFGRGSA